MRQYREAWALDDSYVNEETHQTDKTSKTSILRWLYSLSPTYAQTLSFNYYQAS